MSDSELVHLVCRNERLTFFNFLREHNSDTVLHTEEGIKEQLNREYGYYFKKEGQIGQGREVDFYGP